MRSTDARVATYARIALYARTATHATMATHSRIATKATLREDRFVRAGGYACDNGYDCEDPHEGDTDFAHESQNGYNTYARRASGVQNVMCAVPREPWVLQHGCAQCVWPFGLGFFRTATDSYAGYSGRIIGSWVVSGPCLNELIESIG